MLNDIERVLISEQEIAEKVKELGQKITNDYKNEKLLIITILKGSVVFAADLLREIKMPVEIDFMCISSYGNDSKSSGVVKIVKDLNQPIEGVNVLVIEDILDSGNTLSHLTELLKTRNPKSIKIATLLDKPDRRVAEVEVTYKGFTIPDEFVVGYGLDYGEKYRNIPFVGVLKREVYEKE
ncbi:MAG: hypoxanthine phosphoribosyltransferase [Clostridia bacterium]|nr:hypoxanthine phosphoribosyltransferase [Clostridia bacterium]